MASNLFIGEPIGAVYTYVSDGIIQIGDDVPEGFNIGTHRIIDKNEDTVIDPNDRVYNWSYRTSLSSWNNE